MSLNLNAKQQFIIDIFSGKKKYIIPHYQRAYSWDTEQCNELLEDLLSAYELSKEDNEDEGYFLGNIVVASNTKEKYTLEVIDGQQRLITLTLLIKVLFEFCNDDTDLEKALQIPSKQRGGEPEQRLITKVFEKKDGKILKKILKPGANTSDLCLEKNKDNFSLNLCFIKKILNKYFKDNTDDTDDIVYFSEFILEKTSLLPIETSDEDKETARNKALKIFETINNRGRDLSSSDIFKARLYSMALDENESELFISKWEQFTQECENFNDKDYSVDRIFKIYSYSIRGLNGVTKSEIGLMSYFSSTFFKGKKYNSVMNDLLNLTASVEFYKKNIINTSNLELTRWFQLIHEYTNNYPKDTLILYIYKNKSFEKYNNLLESFVKNLVKYSYYRGSTTAIKSKMYQLMVDTMRNEHFNYKVTFSYLDEDKFSFLGRLYKGFGLLNIYLDDNISPTYPYYIKRLRDVTPYPYDNKSYYDLLGHTVVLNSDKRPMETNINFKDMNLNSYNKRKENQMHKLLNFFNS